MKVLSVFALGEWLVDPETRSVSRGSEVVRISPKAMGVLDALGSAKGKVLSRARLLELVWPDVTVGEEVLTHAIAELRKALGDNTRQPRYIATVPKSGYRLIAPLEPPQPAETMPALNDVADTGSTTTDSSAAPEPGFLLGRERKQVTILDCGLTDTNSLTRTADDDAITETVLLLHKVARDVIERYEGAISEWQGDGFVALFGAPHALDDHPRRALGAAKDVLQTFEDEAAQAGNDFHPVDLSIGIHTGPVVVGLRHPGSDEIFTAAGVTSETAKRLRQVAPPAGIVTSEETHEIVSNEVDATPIAASEDGRKAILIGNVRQQRSGVLRRDRPSRGTFVGRAPELEILLDRVRTLSTGGGRVVAVVGDPGIGKSRLVDELEARLATPEVRFVRAHCLPHGRSSPYLPLAALVRELCGITGDADASSLESQISGHISKIGCNEPEAVSLLLQVLGLQADVPVLPELASAERQRRTFDALHRLVAAACKSASLVMLFEDVHWIDATSLMWLEQESRGLAGLPILLLVTHRPNFRAEWPTQPPATQIALPRLTPEDSRRLISSISGNAELTDDVVDDIVGRGQGNPFFLEELAFAFSESADEAGFVPETVQAVIAARIDHLNPGDKRLLQIMSVVGARIPEALLRRIDQLDSQSRNDSLRRLQEAELVYERRSAPDRHFAFNHALTQEVAYSTLVARTRRTIHRDIAGALVMAFPEIAAERPEMLAAHFTEAGQTDDAITYWHEAGRQAASRATGIEAIAHFEAALALLDELPDDKVLARKRLAIMVDLGVALWGAKGPGAPELGQHYNEVRDLSQTLGEVREDFVALWGLWHYELLRTEFGAANDLLNQMLAVSESEQDEELGLQAHHAGWTTARFSGAFDDALSHANTGLAICESRPATEKRFPFGGHDPLLCGQATRAFVLGIQGDLDSARQEFESAQKLAAEKGHRPSVAQVHVFAVDLYLAAREPGLLATSARQLMELADDLGFTMHKKLSGFALAWCRYANGDHDGGIGEMQAALDDALSLVETAREPYHLAVFAECLAQAGRFDDAGKIVEDAFGKIVGKHEQHWAQSEAQRIRGEILRQMPANEDTAIEDHFERAINIARDQGAVLFELRSSASLADHYMRQGKPDDVQALLEPLYSRFEPTADNADLRRIRDLLASCPQDTAPSGAR